MIEGNDGAGKAIDVQYYSWHFSSDALYGTKPDPKTECVKTDMDECHAVHLQRFFGAHANASHLYVLNAMHPLKQDSCLSEEDVFVFCREELLGFIHDCRQDCLIVFFGSRDL